MVQSSISLILQRAPTRSLLQARTLRRRYLIIHTNENSAGGTRRVHGRVHGRIHGRIHDRVHRNQMIPSPIGQDSSVAAHFTASVQNGRSDQRRNYHHLPCSPTQRKSNLYSQSCKPYLHSDCSSPSMVMASSSSFSFDSERNQKGRKFNFNQIWARTKVFVSKHNQSLNVTSSQITEYCSKLGISQDNLRATNTHVIIRECPFCEKPTMGKADNMFKIYVQIGGGAYFCHRCGAKGSWFDFKQKLGGYEIFDSKGEALTSSPARPRATSSSSANSAQASRTKYNQQIHSTNMALSNNTSTCLPMPSPKLQATYITNLLDNSNVSSEEALTYLTKTRGFTKQTLRKFGVGLGSYNFPSTKPGNQNRFVKADCVTFPWIMKASEIHEQESLRGGAFHYEGGDSSDIEGKKEKEDPFVTRRIKARALSSKSNQRLDPPGGGWGLFGWHTVPDDAKEIIITEGEYDAMAVYQATGRHAVSLPNGCRSLPVEVLPMLERFDSVYLWMDNDGPGREGAEAFAKKIGINRCFIVQPQAQAITKDVDDKNKESSSPVIPKDANEALLLGLDLEEIIQSAGVVPHERVVTFAELRSQVIHEMLNPEKYVGVPVPSLPKLTGILKGFRRGELTVLTGPTGSGKTTLLSQLSLDFSENDVRTLWGSFEIKNTRLMHNLLKQYARGSLILQKDQDKQKQLEAIEVLADKFQELPMYFMKFHGGSDVDDVIDAMEYSVYVHDVQHIILDNMQFMLSRNSRGFSSFDKFDMQDIALEKFRSFATTHNVHVTLVVHPRKENEGDRLGMSSVYGSAKATQEADNVLILQNDGNRKFIEVKKNRFDGTVGYCPIHFDADSRRYCDSADSVVVPQRGGGGGGGSNNNGSTFGGNGSSYDHSNSSAAQNSTRRTTARFVSSASSSSSPQTRTHAPTAALPITHGDGNRAVLKSKSHTSTWDSILEK